MPYIRLNKALLYCLIATFLTLQWSATHLHLSNNHTHDGSHHNHHNEFHAHYSIESGTNAVNTLHHSDNNQTVEFDFELSNQKSEKLEKSLVAITSSSESVVAKIIPFHFDFVEVDPPPTNPHFLTSIKPRAPPFNI